MPNTRYRRGAEYAADMAVYARSMAGDSPEEHARLKRNLVRALRGDAAAAPLPAVRRGVPFPRGEAGDKD